jgi:hypothetical protein
LARQKSGQANPDIERRWSIKRQFGCQRHSERDSDRPDDLEALEHSKDIVVELESFPTGLPTEIAAMGSHPPASRPVLSPLIPSERLIDLGQRLNRYFRATPDEPCTPSSVHSDSDIRSNVASGDKINQRSPAAAVQSTASSVSPLMFQSAPV